MKSENKKLYITVLSSIMAVCLCTAVGLTFQGKHSVNSIAGTRIGAYDNDYYVVTDPTDFSYGVNSQGYVYIDGFSADFISDFIDSSTKGYKVPSGDSKQYRFRLEIPDTVPASAEGATSHAGEHVYYVQEGAFADYTDIADVITPENVYWQAKEGGLFVINNAADYAEEDGETASITSISPNTSNTLIIPSPLWYDVDADGAIDEYEGKYIHTEVIGDVSFSDSKTKSTFKNLVISSGVTRIAALTEKNGAIKIEGALRKNSSLEHVYFATGRTTVLPLYLNTFEDSTALKTVHISAGVLLADGARVFQGCTSITNVYTVNESNPNVPSFYVVGNGGALYTDSYDYTYYDRNQYSDYIKWYEDSSGTYRVREDYETGKVTLIDRASGESLGTADGGSTEGGGSDNENVDGVYFTDLNKGVAGATQSGGSVLYELSKVKNTGNFDSLADGTYSVLFNDSYATIAARRGTGSLSVSTTEIKLSGGGDKTKNVIAIRLLKPSEITVSAKGGSSARYLILENSNGDKTANGTLSVDADYADVSVYITEKGETLPAGVYFLYSQGSGINIQNIKVTPSSAESVRTEAPEPNSQLEKNALALDLPATIAADNGLGDGIDVPEGSLVLDADDGKGSDADFGSLSSTSNRAPIASLTALTATGGFELPNDGGKVTFTASSTNTGYTAGANNRYYIFDGVTYKGFVNIATGTELTVNYNGVFAISLYAVRQDSSSTGGQIDYTYNDNNGDNKKGTLSDLPGREGTGTSEKVLTFNDVDSKLTLNFSQRTVGIVAIVITPVSVKPPQPQLTISEDSGVIYKSKNQTINISKLIAAKDFGETELDTSKLKYEVSTDDSNLIEVTDGVGVISVKSGASFEDGATATVTVTTSQTVEVEGESTPVSNSVTYTVTLYNYVPVARVKLDKTKLDFSYDNGGGSVSVSPESGVVTVTLHAANADDDSYVNPAFEVKLANENVIKNSAITTLSNQITVKPDEDSKTGSVTVTVTAGTASAQFTVNIIDKNTAQSAELNRSRLIITLPAGYEEGTLSGRLILNVKRAPDVTGNLNVAWASSNQTIVADGDISENVVFDASSQIETHTVYFKIIKAGITSISATVSVNGVPTKLSCQVVILPRAAIYGGGSTRDHTVTYQRLVLFPPQYTAPGEAAPAEEFTFAYSATTEIGNSAFFATHLTVIDIPDRINSIGDYAFRFSDYLQTVYLPNNATLGDAIFGQESDADDKTSYTAGKLNFNIVASSPEFYEKLVSDSSANMSRGSSNVPGKNSDSDGYDYLPYLTYEITVNIEYWSFTDGDKNGSYDVGEEYTVEDAQTEVRLYNRAANFVKAAERTTFAPDDNNNVSDLLMGHYDDKNSPKVGTKNTLKARDWYISAGGWYIKGNTFELPDKLNGTTEGQWYYGQTELATTDYASLLQGAKKGVDYLTSVTYTDAAKKWYNENKDSYPDTVKQSPASEITANLLPYDITIINFKATKPINGTTVAAPDFQVLGSTQYTGATTDAATNPPLMEVEFDYTGYPVTRVLSGYDPNLMTSEITDFEPHELNQKKYSGSASEKVEKAEYEVKGQSVPYDIGTYTVKITLKKGYTWKGTYNGVRLTPTAEIDGKEVAGNDTIDLYFKIKINPRTVSVPGEANVIATQYTGAEVAVFENKSYYEVISYDPFNENGVPPTDEAHYGEAAPLELSDNGLPYAIGSYYVYLRLIDDKYPAYNVGGAANTDLTPNLVWNPEPTKYDRSKQETDTGDLVRVQLNIQSEPSMRVPVLSHPSGTAQYGGSKLTLTYSGAPYSFEELFGSYYKYYAMSATVTGYTPANGGSVLSVPRTVLDAGTYTLELALAKGYKWLDNSTRRDPDTGAMSEVEPYQTLKYIIVVEQAIVSIPSDQPVPGTTEKPYEFTIMAGAVYHVTSYQKVVDGEDTGDPISTPPSDTGVYKVQLDLNAEAKNNYVWATGNQDPVTVYMYVTEDGSIPVPEFRKNIIGATVTNGGATMSFDYVLNRTNPYSISDLFINYLSGAQNVSVSYKPFSAAALTATSAIRNAGTYTITFTLANDIFWWKSGSTVETREAEQVEQDKSPKVFTLIINQYRVTADDETAALAGNEAIYPAGTGYSVVSYQKYTTQAGEEKPTGDAVYGRVTEAGSYLVTLRLTNGNFKWADQTGVKEDGTKVVHFAVSGELVANPEFNISWIQSQSDIVEKTVQAGKDSYTLGIVLKNEVTDEQLAAANFSLDGIINIGQTNGITKYNETAAEGHKISITLGAGPFDEGLPYDPAVHKIESAGTYSLKFSIPETDYEEGNIAWESGGARELSYTLIIIKAENYIAAPTAKSLTYKGAKYEISEALQSATGVDETLSSITDYSNSANFKGASDHANELLNAGTYTLALTAASDYVFSDGVSLTQADVKVTINPAQVNPQIAFKGGDSAYEGKDTKKEAEVTFSESVKPSESDCTITYSDPNTVKTENDFYRTHVTEKGMRATVTLNKDSAAYYNFTFNSRSKSAYEDLLITPVELSATGSYTAPTVKYTGKAASFNLDIKDSEHKGADGIYLVGVKAGDVITVKVTYTTDGVNAMKYSFKDTAADPSEGNLTRRPAGANYMVAGEGSYIADYKFTPSAAATTSLDISITIEPAEVTEVKWFVDSRNAQNSYVYDGKTHKVTAKAYWNDGESNKEITLTLDGEKTFKDVKAEGAYNFALDSTESWIDGNVVLGDSVTAEAKKLDVTVAAKPITVTPPGEISWNYNSAAKSATRTVTYDNSKLDAVCEGDEVEVEFTYTVEVNDSGRQTATVAVTTTNINYNVSSSASSVQVTINKVRISYTPENRTLKSKPYIGYLADKGWYGYIDGDPKTEAKAFGITAAIVEADGVDIAATLSYTLSYKGAGGEAVADNKIINAGSYTVTLTLSDDMQKNYYLSNSSGNTSNVSVNFTFTVTPARVQARLVPADGVTDEDGVAGQVTLTYDFTDKRDKVKAEFYLEGTSFGTKIEQIGEKYTLAFYNDATSTTNPLGEVVKAGTYFVRATLNSDAANNFTIVRSGTATNARLIISPARVTVSGTLNLNDLEGELKAELEKYLVYNGNIKTIAITTSSLSEVPKVDDENKPNGGNLDDSVGGGVGYGGTHPYFYLALTSADVTKNGTIEKYGLTIENFYGLVKDGDGDDAVITFMFATKNVTPAEYTIADKENNTLHAQANIPEKLGKDICDNYVGETLTNDWTYADYSKATASVTISKVKVSVVWTYSGKSGDTTVTEDDLSDGKLHITFDNEDKFGEFGAYFTSEYVPSNGGKFTLTITRQTVLNANDYTLVISNTELSLHELAGNTTLIVTIDPYEIKQADINRLATAWQNTAVKPANRLASGEYSVEGVSDPVKATNAFVQNADGVKAKIELAVSFTLNGATAFKIESGDYNGNEQIDSIYSYTATVKISLASNNFKWGASYSLANHVSASVDEGKLVLTKLWYIVASINGVETDVTVSGSTVSGEGLTWIFGENISVTEPTLQNGNTTAEAYTFSLTLKGGEDTVIASGIQKNTLSQWLNKATPAGTYELVLSIAAYNTGSGSSYSENEIRYDVIVKKATLTVNAESLNKDFSYEYNGEAQLPDEELKGVVVTLDFASLRADTSWSDSQYDKYYFIDGASEQSRILLSATAGGYQNIESFKSSASAPKSVKLTKNSAGDGYEETAYTIYYDIRALNYADYSYTEEHTFSVTITRRAVKLVVSGDGSKIYGSSQDSGLYWTYISDSNARPTANNIKYSYTYGEENEKGLINSDNITLRRNFYSKSDSEFASPVGNLPANAGEYVLRLTFDGLNNVTNRNYVLTGAVEGKEYVGADGIKQPYILVPVTVNKADWANVPESKTVTYNGEVQKFTESGSYSESYDEGVTVKNAATYNVYLTLTNPNYKWSDTSGAVDGKLKVTLTIQPLKVKVTVNGAENLKYSGRAQGVTLSFSDDNDVSSELKNSDYIITYNGAEDLPLNAKSYSVTVKFKGDANTNYRFDDGSVLPADWSVVDDNTKLEGTLVIDKAEVKVTYTAAGEGHVAHVYDGQDFDAVHNIFATHYTVSSEDYTGALVRDTHYEVSFKGTRGDVTVKNADTYTVTVKIKSEYEDNFKLVTESIQDIIITPETISSVTVNGDYSYDGTEQRVQLRASLTGFASGGYTVTYLGDTPENTQFINADMYSITVELTGDNVYNFEFAETSSTFTRESGDKATLTAKVEMKPMIVSAQFTDNSFEYDGEEHKSATYSSVKDGAPVEQAAATLTYPDTAEKAYVNAGRYTIKATLNSKNYAFGGTTGEYVYEYSGRNLIITQAELSGFTVASKIYNGVNQTVTKADVTFIRKDGKGISAELIPATASVSGNGTNAGKYAVTVILADDNYKWSADAGATTNRLVLSEAFEITAAEVTISVEQSYKYTGSEITLSITFANSLNPDVLPDNYQAVYAGHDAGWKPVSVGSYNVDITLQGEDATNFNITNNEQFTIQIEGNSIVRIVWTGTSGTYTYNGLNQISSITATGYDGDGNDYRLNLSVTKNGESAQFRNGGAYVITAELTESMRSGFNAISSSVSGGKSVNITISKARAIVTVSGDDDLVYNGRKQEVTVTVTSAAPSETFTVDTDYTVNYVTDFTNGGEHTLTVQLKGVKSENFMFPNNSDTVTRTVSIGRAEITEVKWYVDDTDVNSEGYVYDGQTHTVTAYGVWGDDESQVELTVDNGSFINANRDGYNFTAVLAADDEKNFTLGDSETVIVVTPATVSEVKWLVDGEEVDVDGYVYDGQTHTVTAYGVWGVDKQVELNVDDGSFINANRDGYNFTAALSADDEANFTLDDSGTVIVVLPATVSGVEWFVDGEEVNADGYVYDGQTHTVTAKGTWNEEKLSLSVAENTFVNANADGYSYTASLGSDNFTFGAGVDSDTVIVVAKANPTLTAADKSVEYDGTEQTVTYADLPAYVEESNVRVVYVGGSAPVNAGEYSVTIEIVGTDNYNAFTKTVTITISKVILNVQWSEKTEFTEADAVKTPYEGVDKTQYADKVTVTYTDADGNAVDGAPAAGGDYKAVVTLNDTTNFTLSGETVKSFKITDTSISDGDLDGSNSLLWLIVGLSALLGLQIVLTGYLVIMLSKTKKNAPNIKNGKNSRA